MASPYQLLTLNGQGRTRLCSSMALALLALRLFAQNAEQRHMAPVIEARTMRGEAEIPLNLCTLSRATASSVHSDRFRPHNAIDGDPVSIQGKRENCWCSATDEPSRGQWFQVEFPGVESFESVRVWYRVVLGEHRFVPQSVTIQASMDGRQWQTLLARCTDVPKLHAAPDTAPRVYTARGRAKCLRLLFEDGAQPGDVYDVVEIVELIVPAPEGWTPPDAGDETLPRVQGGTAATVLFPGEQALDVTERHDAAGGEVTVSGLEVGPTRLRWPLGEIGTQAPAAVPEFAEGHFERMLTSNDDVWAQAVLAQPGDPDFEAVAGFTYPYKYPHCYVGVREGAVEPVVAWDGSVAYNETGDYMAFGLNGRRVPKPHVYQVRRGLVDGYLPAAVTVYVDRELGVGWEEVVACDDIEGRLFTFIRLRLRNVGTVSQRFEFSLFPFVPYRTGRPRLLTPSNLRVDGHIAYVGSGATEPGFWLSTAGGVKRDRLAYDVELAPGEHWALAVKFNGDHACGNAAQPFLDRVVPRSLFAVLRDQKLAWDQFFADGMTLRTPDAKLDDIIRATAAHTFVDIDGDVVKGGAFNSYDIHYPLLTMRIVRYCLDWGYADNARRYLEYLLCQPLNPIDGGPQSLFSERGTSPVYDGGYFLQVLARYHQYTRDDSFIRRHSEAIDTCVNYILRKRDASLKAEPEGSPNRGLILGRTTGDLKHASYAYCNDAPSWRGLIEIAKVLADIAQRSGDESFGRRARTIAAEADAYRADILRSIDTVTIMGSKPPFIPIIVATAQPYGNMHLNSLVSYTNFRMYNHLLDAGILDERKTAWILDYRKTRGGEILGMIRWGNMVDNFLCEDVQWEKLRLERVREVLLNFYSYISYDLAPGVWTGYEEFCLDPMKEDTDPPGRSNLNHSWWPRWRTRMTHGYEQTRVSANIPELARFLIIQAERDRDLLWLGRAMPRAWLRDGAETIVGNAPTRWGRLDLHIRSQVEQGTITARLNLRGSQWPRINLRFRHPGKATLETATVNGSPVADFERESGTLHLPAGLSEEVTVETVWSDARVPGQ